MTVRSKIANMLVEWVGSDSLEIVEVGTGWPSEFRAKTTTDWVRIAAYIGPIGHSQRGRGDVERRFQNPGQNRPILDVPEVVPLLLGLYESDGSRVIVGMEVQKRVGRTTRQSLFMPLHLLRTADRWGWAEHFSSAGEKLYAFQPRLLPIYIDLCRSHVTLASNQIEQLVLASGADDLEAGPEAVARLITTVKRLVRAAVFSRDVRSAYFERCAMCGLDSSLVEGAHIYPVEAPRSEDHVWNGIALCRNHHAAFDSHIIYVEPDTRRVLLHPNLTSDCAAGSKAFVDATFPTLCGPRAKSQRPRSEMFEKRYDFYSPKYSWI